MSSNPNCEVCAGAGYVFGADDNSLNGTVIQRCDTCAIFDGDEAAAEWVSSQIKSLSAEVKRLQASDARLVAAMWALDKECCFVHRYGGTACNQKEADAAEAEFRAALAQASEAGEVA